jgi:hypothetical protein
MNAFDPSVECRWTVTRNWRVYQQPEPLSDATVTMAAGASERTSSRHPDLATQQKRSYFVAAKRTKQEFTQTRRDRDAGRGVYSLL